MSAPEPIKSTPQSPRLGIIHFLGWITGIAVVLAIYRGALDSGWLDVVPDRYEETRWWQLGYGVVYCSRWSRRPTNWPTSFAPVEKARDEP